ncbi:MAG: hypothetical protein A3F31_05020 [Candidatus Levybacteria bacterium RIFCSPHIGHO2_12_FULL_38_12]|nr:MAG: hypothetical protein A2770_00210 [Candidatus Levybacteria bacterium RIFCSPHIGHO2_01_FULL_38_12]OGH21728.1 MAG: hypothetical protein A3D75_00885 [Candidatus Levybacteria bacterium RIFCSPHIGHO2_02_FULL_37_18]OGH22614.1 MAG: hypothetical protein A3F31_05020 [Candidatus Levybacteria bacterium RIFCSPHIGHO2_12_FULL_38_12]OGH33349.1 MAG: hypothetical protein A3A47_03835 [Candidatus Levybacteria bacterium RIFCSPLOWO2_01_FULL_37_20]OGH43738.1 MAG: hypothetical protein A3J14_04385 [Candidatus Lev
MNNIALVGLGVWGKKLLRTFSEICSIGFVCTTGKDENISWLKDNHPGILHTTDYETLLARDDIDAVIIATPINTHYMLAKKALKANKHIFLEKPLTNNILEAEELLDLSKKNKKLLFVGNVFLYHSAFQEIKDILNGQKIEYIYASWEKFGSFGEDLLWNLLPHDLGIIFLLMGYPSKFEIIEQKGFITDIDILVLRLKYEDGRSCLLQYNRIADKKNKRLTIITDTMSFAWSNNDLFTITKENLQNTLTHSSDKDPLVLEAQEFLSLLEKKEYRNDLSNLDLDVVRLLSAINNSLTKE